MGAVKDRHDLEHQSGNLCSSMYSHYTAGWIRRSSMLLSQHLGVKVSNSTCHTSGILSQFQTYVAINYPVNVENKLTENPAQYIASGWEHDVHVTESMKMSARLKPRTPNTFAAALTFLLVSGTIPAYAFHPNPFFWASEIQFHLMELIMDIIKESAPSVQL